MASLKNREKKNYHLVRLDGRWLLKRHGAKRALIDFGNRIYGDDFDQVISATMTYADVMLTLFIHNDDGSVLHKFDREFIELWRWAQ